MWNRFKTLDPWLYAIPVILIGISVLVILSLTVESLGSGLYLRQLVFGLVGLLLMIIATFVDYRSLRAWWIWLYGAGVIGLLLVRLPGIGKSDFGAQRWINIGPFQLQPSEVMKLVVIIALAALLSRAVKQVSWKRFAAILVIFGLPVLEVVAQPDLGTAIVITVAGFGILMYSKISRAQRLLLVGSLLAVVAAFTLSFQEVSPFTNLLKDYQKDRLASFVDPGRDPDKTGYNILQSVIAVGSGGLTGNGLGVGNQSRLNFLPVAHADFIFAGISEAWGLVGSVGIIGLYIVLFFRLLQAARIAKDDFGMLLCIGVAVKILVETTVNIGMNIQLMPVTGIPLPFLSYGGTTLLVNAMAIGIVQSVVIRYKRLTF